MAHNGKTAVRKGGRKKNEWTVITRRAMLDFIEKEGIKQKAFAAHLGVTNSTFHNWKNGRCAPDDDVQGKILALINGKEKITMGKRGPRGASSTTLAAMDGKKKTGKKKVAKKKATKKTAAKTGKKKKAGRKPRSRVSAALASRSASNGNSNGNLEDWNDLKALGQFIRSNKDRSAEELQSVVGVMSTAAAIFS